MFTFHQTGILRSAFPRLLIALLPMVAALVVFMFSSGKISAEDCDPMDICCMDPCSTGCGNECDEACGGDPVCDPACGGDECNLGCGHDDPCDDLCGNPDPCCGKTGKELTCCLSQGSVSCACYGLTGLDYTCCSDATLGNPPTPECACRGMTGKDLACCMSPDSVECACYGLTGTDYTCCSDPILGNPPTPECVCYGLEDKELACCNNPDSVSCICYDLTGQDYICCSDSVLGNPPSPECSPCDDPCADNYQNPEFTICTYGSSSTEICCDDSRDNDSNGLIDLGVEDPPGSGNWVNGDLACGGGGGTNCDYSFVHVFEKSKVGLKANSDAALILGTACSPAPVALEGELDVYAQANYLATMPIGTVLNWDRSPTFSADFELVDKDYCLNIEGWQQTVPFGLTRNETTGNCNSCGNGVCDPNDCDVCPADCSIQECQCGNGQCQISAQNNECSTCPSDCATTDLLYCGDGVCGSGESCENCPSDCPTGDVGSCIGCTDPDAGNYNPGATVSDGSCAYPVSTFDCSAFDNNQSGCISHVGCSWEVSTLNTCSGSTTGMLGCTVTGDYETTASCGATSKSYDGTADCSTNFSAGGSCPCTESAVISYAANGTGNICTATQGLYNIGSTSYFSFQYVVSEVCPSGQVPVGGGCAAVCAEGDTDGDGLCNCDPSNVCSSGDCDPCWNIDDPDIFDDATKAAAGLTGPQNNCECASGLIYNSGTNMCEAADTCLNIAGSQTSVPVGMIQVSNGSDGFNCLCDPNIPDNRTCYGTNPPSCTTNACCPGYYQDQVVPSRCCLNGTGTGTTCPPTCDPAVVDPCCVTNPPPYCVPPVDACFSSPQIVSLCITAFDGSVPPPPGKKKEEDLLDPLKTSLVNFNVPNWGTIQTAFNDALKDQENAPIPRKPIFGKVGAVAVQGSSQKVCSYEPCDYGEYCRNVVNPATRQVTATCVAPTPFVEITVTPPIVPYDGGTCLVSWSSGDMYECTISGPGIFHEADMTDPQYFNGYESVVHTAGTSIYTISCKELVQNADGTFSTNNIVHTSSASCRTNPKVKEF